MPINWNDSRISESFDGYGDVGKLVQDFYLRGNYPVSPAYNEDEDSDDEENAWTSVSVPLAPSFAGQYDSKIRNMDYHTKIMTIGTLRLVAEMSNKEWEYIIAEMVDNPYVQRDDNEVSRVQKFAKESSAFRSPNDAFVEEVYGWFKNLIADDDVILNSGIDKKVMAAIVTRAASQDYLLDIPVLRFPDSQRDFIQFYRINLRAASNGGERTISAEYNSYIYRADEWFIDQTLGDRNYWVKEWESVFNV